MRIKEERKNYFSYFFKLEIYFFQIATNVRTTWYIALIRCIWRPEKWTTQKNRLRNSTCLKNYTVYLRCMWVELSLKNRESNWFRIVIIVIWSPKFPSLAIFRCEESGTGKRWRGAEWWLFWTAGAILFPFLWKLISPCSRIFGCALEFCILSCRPECFCLIVILWRHLPSLCLFDDNNGMKITKLVPLKNENDCKFFKGMDYTIDSFWAVKFTWQRAFWPSSMERGLSAHGRGLRFE